MNNEEQINNKLKGLLGYSTKNDDTMMGNCNSNCTINNNSNIVKNDSNKQLQIIQANHSNRVS